MTQNETTSEAAKRLLMQEGQSPEQARSAALNQSAYATNVRTLRKDQEENADNFKGKKAPPFKKGNDAHDGAEDSDFKKGDDEDDAKGDAKEEAARPPQSYPTASALGELVTYLDRMLKAVRKLHTAEKKREYKELDTRAERQKRFGAVNKATAAFNKGSSELNKLR